MEKASIVTMIEPPMVSPVTAETMPAANRMRDNGSSSRRAIAANRLVRFVTASALGPYRLRRASASFVLNPSRLQRLSAHSASGVRVQKCCLPSELPSVIDEFLEASVLLTRVESRNTRGKFPGMSSDLCVFFRGKHADRTTRRWAADGIFQRLISCGVEVDAKPRETATDRGPHRCVMFSDPAGED